jgi:glycosyltransferase involved in cell wall biosynthesis
MNEPLVSIGMVTYNHAPYIAQAIEGVLQQQTNFPFELVIGEDCSPDGTREIVSEYHKKHPDIIRLIMSDENIGGLRNFLRIVYACQGKYLAFCEGDDYWHHPNKLQKQVDYLEHHPECGLVFTDYDFYFNSTRKLVSMVNHSKGFRLPMNLTIEQAIGPEGGVIRTSTIMVRKQLLDQVIEGDPYLHQNEKLLVGDLQLFAEITLISRVSYFPESMATYRILEESASRSRDPIKTARFYKSACEVKLYLCDKHKLSENIRRTVESDWCNFSLRLAFHTRNRELADEVRRRKKTFTWKEWFQYHGAKQPMFNPPLRLAALVRRRFLV